MLNGCDVPHNNKTSKSSSTSSALWLVGFLQLMSFLDLMSLPMTTGATSTTTDTRIRRHHHHHHPRRRRRRHDHNPLGLSTVTATAMTATVQIRGGGGGGPMTSPLLSSTTTTTTTTTIQKKKDTPHTTTKSVSSSSDNNHHNSNNNKALSTTTTKMNNNNKTQVTRMTMILDWMDRHKLPLGLTILTMLFLYMERHVWYPYVVDKKRLQQVTLELLQSLKQDDDDDENHSRHPIQPYVVYAMGMAIWEALGLSTIPVETAAGMVFDYWHAVAASAIGKVIGALVAFAIGRTVLHDVVQGRLLLREKEQGQQQSSSSSKSSSSSSPTLLSLLRYNTQSAFQTAWLMKFSIFPEFIKNVGTAVLFPAVQWYHVFITTIVHGGLFTTVWAAIGHEAMMELQQQTTASTATTATASTPMITPPKWIYRIMIPSVLTLGMGLPVVTMAWWARQLRKEQHKQHQEAAAITTAAASILSLKGRKKRATARSSTKTLLRDDERPKRRWFGR